MKVTIVKFSSAGCKLKSSFQLDYRTYADRSSAFGIDAYSSSRPVSIGVEKPSDITAQFDSISYSKVSDCFLHFFPAN